MRTAFLVYLCFLLTWLLAVPVHAEPPRHAFQLTYVRGEGAGACPDEAVLRKELAGIMHYDPVKSDASRRLTAIIERRKGELTGIAIMRDETGHVLWETDMIPTTSPCRVLVGALALAIDAWLGRPKAVPERPAATPEPASTPAAPAVSAPPPEPRSPPPAQPSPPTEPMCPPASAPRNVSGYAGLDILGSFGVTPTPSLGAEIFFGVRLRDPALVLEAGARLTATLVATTAGMSNDMPITARSAFTAVTFAGCGHFSRLAVFCPIVGAGSVAFTFPSGLPNSSSRSWFGIVGARLGIEHALAERIALRAFAELEGLPGSEVLKVLTQVVWTKPPAMGSAGIGIAFGLW